MEHIDVVVVGGGSAGLALSHELLREGVEHVVLERGRIGQTWRDRWDSFRLVTPNWSVQLPGHHYDGADPDGFMPRDEIVAWLEQYCAACAAPIREGVDVTSIERDATGGFILHTTSGSLHAGAVALATGAYQRPHRPRATATLPPELPTLDVEGYTNERDLPPGRVLVLGSGQSGCQIAEELHEAGREVVLSCGRAPWSPRRLGSRDMFWWAVETGFMDMPIASLPDAAARLTANLLVTGHHGGADLNLRTLRAMGVTLAGHFVGAGDGEARFAPDLADSVAWGDGRYHQLMERVRKLAEERGLETPAIEAPPVFDERGPERVQLAGLGAVIVAAGFRPDYRSWLPWSEAFDELGFPIHRDGASTVVPGLYFIGVHFLRKRKSSLLIGVGEDATIVARQMAGR